MSEDNDQSESPQNNHRNSNFQLIGLLAAFLPSIIGISCFHLKQPMPWLFPTLVCVNLLCSMLGAAGIASGIKNGAGQFFVGLLLFVFFFVMNVFIVLFIGCSGMGRIAP